jgi:hypothetical protein
LDLNLTSEISFLHFHFPFGELPTSLSQIKDKNPF